MYKSNYYLNLYNIYFMSIIITYFKLIKNKKAIKYQKVENSGWFIWYVR